MGSVKQWKPFSSELTKVLCKSGGEGESDRERGVCFAKRKWHSNAKWSGVEEKQGLMMALESFEDEDGQERKRTRRYGVLKRIRDGYANVDWRIKNGKSHGVPELIAEPSL